MLTIPIERVCFIIAKARQFDVKEAEVVPDPASDAIDELDPAVGVLEDHPGDPTYEELAGAILALNDDEKIGLVALTWIGRGDYTGEEWDEAHAQASDVGTRNFPGYLTGIPLLGDYLEEGLAALGLSCDSERTGIG